MDSLIMGYFLKIASIQSHGTGEVPAYHVWDPGFDCQYYKKKVKLLGFFPGYTGDDCYTGLSTIALHLIFSRRISY